MLDPHEYRLMLEAFRLRMEDQKRLISLQAYENVRAQAVDRNGRTLYPTFEDFYNPQEHHTDPLARLRESFRKGGK